MISIDFAQLRERTQAVLPAPGRRGSLLGFAAIALVYLAITFYYWHAIGALVIDDAFIYYRYADNFARGNGFVYNPGEYVEGYTSFPWVLLLGVAAQAGLPLIAFSQALGVALGLVTLWATWRVADLLFDHSLLALLPPLFLATNRTFCVWSIEGLETNLFGAAVVLGLLAWLELGTRLFRGRLPVVGVAAAAMALARPEGFALAGLMALIGLAQSLRERAIASFCWNGAAFLAITGSHLVFRYVVYGDLLPNTFYAKVSGVQAGRGYEYLHELAAANGFAWYALITLPGLALLAASGGYRHARLWLLACVAFTFVYLIAIGGDYFEFRMFDPMLPFWGLATAAGLGFVAGHVRSGAPLVAAILTLAWILPNALTVAFPWRGTERHTSVETETFFSANFSTAGRWLARNLEPQEVIAIRPAGAIAYLSRARCIDTLGLNDREIARNTDDVDLAQPAGHQRRLPAGYLEQRGVTYYIGHPQFRKTPAAEGGRWVSAEVMPGAFFIFEILSPEARLEPRVYRYGEHRGLLEGWRPVEDSERKPATSGSAPILAGQLGELHRTANGRE